MKAQIPLAGTRHCRTGWRAAHCFCESAALPLFSFFFYAVIAQIDWSPFSYCLGILIFEHIFPAHEGEVNNGSEVMTSQGCEKREYGKGPITQIPSISSKSILPTSAPEQTSHFCYPRHLALLLCSAFILPRETQCDKYAGTTDLQFIVPEESRLSPSHLKLYILPP